MADLVFRKASACGAHNCIEVATLPDRAVVRDSKDPTGPTITFPAAAWRAFLNGLPPPPDGRIPDVTDPSIADFERLPPAPASALVSHADAEDDDLAAPFRSHI